MKLRSKRFSHATAAINRLPPEIVSSVLSILKEFKFDEGLKNTYVRWDWTVVMRVCRFWYTTAQTTPSLWTDFLDFRSSQKTERCLALSKNASLRVIFTDSYYWTINCFLMVLRHFHRISFLSLEIRDTWEQLKEVMSQPAPRLEVLILSTDHPVDLLFPEPSPFLRCLSLSSFCLSSVPPSFTALTKLELHKTGGLSPFVFLSTLDLCNQLKELDLCDVVWEMVSSELPTVMLPCLNDFDIHIHLPHLMGQNEVLSRIIFPDNCNWTCVCFGTDLADLDFYFQYTQKRLWCEGLKIVLQESKLVVEVLGSVIGCDTDSKDKCYSTLYLRLSEEETPEEMYAHVESLIKNCFWGETVSVNICFDWVTFREEYCIRLLASLSSVQSIEV